MKTPASSVIARLALASLVWLGSGALLAQSAAVSNVIALDLRDRVTVNLSGLGQTYADAPRVVTATTVPAGAPVSVTYNGSPTAPRNAGTYAVRAVVDTATLVGEATGTLTVARAPLSITSNSRRLESSPGVPLTPSYSGFQGDDSASDLDELPQLSTSATATSPRGVYPVVVTGGADANYQITRQEGRLSVISLVGSFEALLRDDTGLPVGRLELKVAPRTLRYTGKLALGGETKDYALAGALVANTAEATGTAQVFVRVPARSGLPGYEYRLNLVVAENVTAELRRNGVRVASADDGRRLAEYTARQPAPWRGTYTTVLADPEVLGTDPRPVPLGAGYAATAVDAMGTLKLTGRLADGTTLTGSFKTDSEAGYRWFVRTKGTRADSYLIGGVGLSAQGGVYRTAAAAGLDVYWAKGAGRDTSYAAGFGPLALVTTIDPWQRATGADLRARLRMAGTEFGFGFTDYGVIDGNGDSVEVYGVPTRLVLNDRAQVTVPGQNPTRWKVTFNTTTGVFTGSLAIKDEVEDARGRIRAVARTVLFHGVLRQPAEADAAPFGRGYFLLPGLDRSEPTRSGEVRFVREIETEEPPTGANAVVSGVVRDALTGGVIPGANLEFFQGGQIVATTSTSAQGNYSWTLPAGPVRVRIGFGGYVATDLYANAVAGETVVADAVLLPPTRTGNGTIRGRVVNALNANGVAGATVRLRAGVNATSGAILQTATADAQGAYTFSAAGGAYTLEAVASGFVNGFGNVVAVGGSVISDQDVRVTPGLANNEVRVVLSWGSTPSDLDSHLAGPASGGGAFHLYYSNPTPTGSGAALDVDDTDSFGPETVTISTLRAGTYRYWVHDFSNRSSTTSTRLSQQSGAKVIVYRGTGSGTSKVAEYNVPGGRVGNAWVVFEINGATGAITPVNTVINVAGEEVVP